MFDKYIAFIVPLRGTLWALQWEDNDRNGTLPLRELETR